MTTRTTVPDPTDFLGPTTEHLREARLTRSSGPAERTATACALGYAARGLPLGALHEAKEGVYAELAVLHKTREIHWGRLNLLHHRS
jgi:hypothetical protein